MSKLGGPRVASPCLVLSNLLGGSRCGAGLREVQASETEAPHAGRLLGRPPHKRRPGHVTRVEEEPVRGKAGKVTHG